VKRTPLKRIGNRRLREAEEAKAFADAVLTRDGVGEGEDRRNRCVRCGAMGPQYPIVAHHRSPRGRNGTDRHDPDNGVSLCSTWGTRLGCHQVVHDHIADDWRDWIEQSGSNQ